MFIAPGSKLILYALQMAVKGDLLLPVPSWVSYIPQARMLKDQVIKVPTILDDNGYQIDPELLRQTIHQARGEGMTPGKIILNSPNNPTGLSIPDRNMQEIAKICEEEDILIISDEIYGFVSFDQKYRSISRYAPAHTAISTGLSKHFSLGGWRVGVGFIPKAVPGLYEKLCNIASELWSSVPSPIQYAVIEAYSHDTAIEDHVRDCSEIHGVINTKIAESLRSAGIKSPAPQGAFYNYPDFENYREKLYACGITSSQHLADTFLKKYGLAALPGIAFAEDPEKLTLRVSGCDYDGTKVLDAYRQEKNIDHDFLKSHAPNIMKQMKVFEQFIDNLEAGKISDAV